MSPMWGPIGGDCGRSGAWFAPVMVLEIWAAAYRTLAAPPGVQFVVEANVRYGRCVADCGQSRSVSA
jgi:hypothetical protein